METPKVMISEAIRMRGETDHLMSPLWVIVPLLGLAMPYILMVWLLVIAPEFISITSMLGIAIVAIVAMWACMVYVLYHLIKRRTAHFKRDSVLREGIIGYLKAKAGKKGESEITSEITTMNLINSEALGEEREKSAVMWTILSFIIPFVWIYVLYFLTKDPQNHDHRQFSFLEQAQHAASKLGINLVVPKWKALPSRSFALYFIITLLIGLFAIYWYYVLIKDFNDHFKAQWQFEDQLISSVA